MALEDLNRFPDERISYHASIVPRGSLRDWELTLRLFGWGEKVEIDGMRYTKRYSSWLDNCPSLRDRLIGNLSQVVKIHPKGFVIEEAYLSDLDILAHLTEDI